MLLIVRPLNGITVGQLNCCRLTVILTLTEERKPLQPESHLKHQKYLDYKRIARQLPERQYTIQQAFLPQTYLVPSRPPYSPGHRKSQSI